MPINNNNKIIIIKITKRVNKPHYTCDVYVYIFNKSATILGLVKKLKNNRVNEMYINYFNF